MARQSGWQGTGMMSSGLKMLALREDVLADFGEGEAVARGVEILQPAGGLDGLEGDAAHAGLLEREVDDLAELIVVEPFFSVTTSVVEMLCSLRWSSACWRMRRRSAPRSSRSGPSSQRIELQIDLEAGHVILEPRAKSGSCAMRMPLVLTMRCLIGRRLAASRISKKCGWIVGSPPLICTMSGSPLVADDAIEHELDLLERAMRLPVRPGFGVADRAGEIAVVGDLDQREATVLLVIGAEAAIVGAAVFDRRVEFQRHLAGLERVARELVVFGVGGDQHFLEAVLAGSACACRRGHPERRPWPRLCDRQVVQRLLVSS